MDFMPISQLRKLSLKCEHKSRNYLTLGRDVILMDGKTEAPPGKATCSHSQCRKQLDRILSHPAVSLGKRAIQCQEASPACRPCLCLYYLSCFAEPHLTLSRLTLSLLCPKSRFPGADKHRRDMPALEKQL